jgi:hypothetical protein
MRISIALLLVTLLFGMAGCNKEPAPADAKLTKAMQVPQGLPGGPPGAPKVLLKNQIRDRLAR